MTSRVEQFLKKVPIHPFFLGLFPPFALWLANISQVPPFAVVRPLLISLLVSGGMFLLCLLAIRRILKAGLVSSLIMSFFFLYGHIFNLLDNAAIGSIIFGRHRVLLPLGFLLVGLITYLILKSKKRNLYLWNMVANVICVFLVLLVGIQIAVHQARTPSPARAAQTPPSAAGAVNSSEGRDIYYILIDAYARQDVLAGELGIDNSDFIRQLQSLGFIVDSCAQVNYDNTVFSLTSSLNMDYLDALGVPDYPEAVEERYDDFVPLLKYSRARQEFEKLGYQFVTFKALYPWIDITDSDIYFDAQSATPLLNRQEAINFQYLFFRNTALRPLLEYLEATPERLSQLPAFLLDYINPGHPLFSLKDYGQYVQNEFAFDTLETLPEIPGKKFIYAHLFAVHQPYVYREDGGYAPAGAIERPQDYANAIHHTNERILEIVKKLIQNSKIPPVIILQGDHGKPVTQLRVRQLNALYLPDGGAEKFYPGMTPVNTFRVILDTYFGQNLGTLPDRSYHSPYQTPYRLEPVAGSCGTP
jgi:hypothetical protein